MTRIGLLVLLALSSCVPAGVPPRVPAPSDIPRLQQLLLRDSADLAARVSLAVAYRAGGRLDEARSLLERLVAERPDEPGAWLLLGLTQEESADWRGARASYDRYLGLAQATELRRAIERRLPWVRRKELEAEVRSSLEHEADLSATAPDPARIAVFPFVLQSADTALRPLSRAIAELLVTDLAVTGRLQVLERAQVQLLLDEIALAESGAVDPATAARGGRLLRAGRVVQGSIEGNQARLRLAAVVGRAGRDSLTGLSPVREEDAIARLFDMEKNLALSLHARLGIELTVAERQRVLQRPTGNLQALLAFGSGLEAEDRGDWAAATTHYARAAAIDPTFAPAATRSEAAAGIADAERTRVEVLVATGVTEQAIPVSTPPQHPALDGLRSTPLTLGLGQTAGSVLVPDPIRGIVPDPLQRDAGAEALGREGVSSRTVLRIIFRRPGN